MVKKTLTVQLDDGLLTTMEAAARLRINVISMQNMRLKGKGPPWIKPSGNRVYYPKSLFEEWLNKTLVVPDQERVA